MDQLKQVNPITGNLLKRTGNKLIDEVTGVDVALLINETPRFVRNHQNYAQNFGYQWNKWNAVLSDSRNPQSDGAKHKLLLKRTHFDQFVTEGKTILECGCGGGDDTEVLLQFGFKEVHSFDISNAVDRAKKFIVDSRAVFSQASIYEIPYPDNSFDFVFCHRVLQHTPDPEEALRCVARKVKSGGVLFVHSYHKTPNYLKNYKYKYRVVTKRLPHHYIESFLEWMAPLMHWFNKKISFHRWGRAFTYRFVPLEFYKEYGLFNEKEIIELEKLVTFDALTPKFDLPMKWETMKGIVEEMGFVIKSFNNNPHGSPIYLTAVKG